MRLRPVRFFKFWLPALLLISPFIVFSYLFPGQTQTFNSGAVTPIVFASLPSEPNIPDNNGFAFLLAENPKQSLSEEQVIPSIPVSESGSYTIAFLGDSMIDVMGPTLPQIKSALKRFYPHAKFSLLNYGMGATNIDYGLQRLTSDYTYLGRQIPSLLSQNPDIVVVESFAYNHGANTQTELDHQWLTIASIISTIKEKSRARIALAATVAPDETTLCDGIEGISFNRDQKLDKARTIRAYLENMVNFATSQGYPLADAYHTSLNSQLNGKSVYVNSSDHLHPSEAGKTLVAEEIAQAIWKNQLLKN